MRVRVDLHAHAARVVTFRAHVNVNVVVDDVKLVRTAHTTRGDDEEQPHSLHRSGLCLSRCVDIGKYRLVRVVIGHRDVTVWDALDMESGKSVQVSVFERGSSMLDHGTIDTGTFVVTSAPHPAPRLELVEISEEDAFFDEPPQPDYANVYDAPKSRAWLWAMPAVACVVAVGLYFFVARTHTQPVATSEVRITEARISPPEIVAPPVVAPTPIATTQPRDVSPAKATPHRAPPPPLPPPTMPDPDPLTL
jgi:hypothetical protein